MNKNNDTDLLNYLLLAIEDQFKYFNGIKTMAESILQDKKEYLRNPSDETKVKALAQFGAPKISFKIDIKDYAFTIKNNPKIVDYIFRYIQSLESCLNFGRAYNDEIIAICQTRLSDEQIEQQIRLQVDNIYSKILFSINMNIFILSQLLEEIFKYNKFLGKKNKLINFIDIDNYTGYIDIISKEITQYVGDDRWLRQFQDVKIKNIGKAKNILNHLNICIDIMKNINSKDYQLAPKQFPLDLVAFEDFKMFGDLSILLTKGLEYMYHFGLKIDNTKAGYFVRSENNSAQIILGKEFEPSIYRGQNFDYPSFIPSYQRENIINDELKHCIEYIKREEFKEYFKITPYYQILSKLNIMGRTFKFDLDAIAQHYEFATNYLDVTKDIQTALFFAYTECVNGKYSPILDFEKYHPTLYVANFAMAIQDKNPLIPVGFQAVLRPQKQTAMAIKINDYKEENPIKYFRKIDLPRDLNVAIGIFNSFNQGQKLFPEEPMKLIEKQIKNNRILSEEIFLKYCKEYNKSEEHLRIILKPYYAIQNFAMIIDSELFVKMKDEVYKKLIPWIKENIFYRKVQFPNDKNPNFYISLAPQYLNGKTFDFSN